MLRRSRRSLNRCVSELLESRRLLAITATGDVIAPTETQAFTGEVATFTDTTPSPLGDYTATVDWGDGAPTSAGTISLNSGTFSVSGSHTYAEDGPFTTSVSINESNAGNSDTGSTTGTANVGEQSLSITALAQSMVEGISQQEDTATFSDPGTTDSPSAFTAIVDWGDGTAPEAGSISGFNGNYTFSGTHQYLKQGTFSVSTTGFETFEPGFSVTAPNTFTVSPGVDLAMTGPAGAITEGGMLVYNVSVTNTTSDSLDDVTFTDPLPAGSSFSFASFSQGGAFVPNGATVTGDLGTVAAGATVTGSIVVQALEEGVQTNTISATYNSLSLTDITQSVNTVVVDAPLTPTSGKTITATKGKSFTGVVGSFTDADPNGDPADYTATINWGDGTTSAGTFVADGAGVDVVGTHTYSAKGSFGVKTAVQDVGGSTATLNSTANVADSAPPPPVSIITDPCDSTKKAVQIDGTSGNDTITVTKSGSAQGKVVVKINGSTKGTFSFTGSIIVHAGSGNDNVSIDSAITRETFIFGEAGNDTVSGGGGSDVIVGGDGNDKLSGNSGRDILIGSNGSDSLSGGNDDDILDGGTTIYDTNISSLCKLQDEWTRTDKSYTFRVQHITQGGGLNGSVKLNASTTFSSSTLKDTLTGGSGSDLFFAAVPGDIITDKASGETVVDVG